MGRVPTLTQELSSLSPRGTQFYCTQRRAPPESFREGWCLLQSFIALEVYLSLHSSATVGFSLRLPCFCSDLLVHNVPVRHLRPQAERQCARRGDELGFWRTKALSSSPSSVRELFLLGASHLASQHLRFLIYGMGVTTVPKSWGLLYRFNKIMYMNVLGTNTPKSWLLLWMSLQTAKGGNVIPVPTRHQSNISAFLSCLFPHTSGVKKYYSHFKDRETGRRGSITPAVRSLPHGLQSSPSFQDFTPSPVIHLPLSFDKLY